MTAIEQQLSSIYNVISNGSAERNLWSLKLLLKKTKVSGKNAEEALIVHCEM